MCLALVPIVVSSAPVTAANPPDDAPEVSLIGDSTMAAMQWYSTASNDIRDIVGDSYRLTFDAESCRRIVIASCRGRFGSTPASVLPLIRNRLKGDLGEAMVVMAGYDDPSLSNAIDQVMAEAEVQGVIRVLWLNYRTNTNYVLPGGLSARYLYDSHNTELAAAARRHPSLQLLDWDGFTADKSVWFAGDGIHLTPDGARGLATFIKTSLDGQPAIGRCRTASALSGQPDAAAGSASLPTTESGFVALAPKRVLDTRDPSLGGAAGKVGTGHTVSLDIGNVVPDDAVAAVLSVTAVDSCLPGFLTVFACGTRPPTSNVNYEVGRITAGLAITPVNDGRVCVFASAATDLIVDVMGAFTPDGDQFHPMTPTRWVDSRGGTVQLPQITGVRAAPSETTVQVAGQGGVAADASAVWMNLTVADPTAATVLTAYPGPCGASPVSSNVNARPLRSMASTVLVGVGDDGTVCIRSFAGNSHVVVDVAGWFGPGSGGLSYLPATPDRLLDSRDSGGQASNADRPVHVDGVSVLNVTAVDSSAAGYVSVRPCGSALLTSLINTAPLEDTANLIAVGGNVGGNVSGNVCVRPNIASHLVVDLVATFVP